MKDPDYLIKVEKAIQEKYGDEAIKNPQETWNKEKEKDYIEQIKHISKLEKPKENFEVNGVLMPKKLFRKESQRTCPVCEIYSFEMKDDVYMAKYKCCFKCYVQYVEGREEKWIKTTPSLKKN